MSTVEEVVMAASEHKYNNNFSFILGLLCFMVCYLHSGWAKGFDVYTLGTDLYAINIILSLLLNTAVPIFFIIWGYLLYKYLYSNESGTLFLKKKILQFYPIYLFFFIVNLISRWDSISIIPIWKIVLASLGLYYQSGLGGGGNIYIVVLFVILTIFTSKYLNLKNRIFLYIFCFFCFILSKFLPHESSNCYAEYFGYYTAYFFGLVLRRFSIFEESLSNNTNRTKDLIVSVICIVGIATPILNFFEINNLEIQYHPSSPEQLSFCFFILYITNKIIVGLKIHQTNFFIFNIIHKIGNNAYGHFLIHAHVINLIIFLNLIFIINPVIIQIFIILFVSFISVYWILPLYWLFEKYFKIIIASSFRLKFIYKI